MDPEVTPKIKWGPEEQGELSTTRTGALLIQRPNFSEGTFDDLRGRINRLPIWDCASETLMLVACQVGRRPNGLWFLKATLIQRMDKGQIQGGASEEDFVGWNRVRRPDTRAYDRVVSIDGGDPLYRYAEDCSQEIDGQAVAGFELLLHPGSK